MQRFHARRFARACICFALSLSVGVEAGAQVRAATRRRADCLGSDSAVMVGAGQVGQLPLNLSLNAVLARCPTAHWSTVNGDETRDTAIVIDRPGFRLVGAVATIADEMGYHRVHIDGTLPIKSWQVSGVSGTLPNGVPLTATWAQVARADGPLRTSELNGIVFVVLCRQPGITLLINDPHPDAPIINASPSVVDSIMADARITGALVASTRQTRARAC